ncbi:adenosine deaminase 2-A-like [Sardina pilchardus]|uniref:adenosine deaminase 2-A-like n=1 Tax=Sardina pilchardus TaxID=27697 RepID=UPI002E147FEF
MGKRTGLLLSGPKQFMFLLRFKHFMLFAADQLYGDADFMFQQDLAPAHSAKATSTWFKEHVVTGQHPDTTEWFKFHILVNRLKLKDALLIANSYSNSRYQYTKTVTALTELYGQPHKKSLKCGLSHQSTGTAEGSTEHQTPGKRRTPTEGTKREAGNMPFRIHCYWLPLFSMMALAFMIPCSGAPDVRERLKKEEAEMLTGGREELSGDEQKLDTRLHTLKENEMKCPPFLPSMHFFKARSHIQKSAVFKVLKEMPKGAALHLHSSAMVSSEWLVEVTKRPKCYMCLTSTSAQFKFSEKQPVKDRICNNDWQLLETLRAGMDNNEKAKFDKRLLMQYISLFNENPESAYPSDNDAWDKLKSGFKAISGLVDFAPVFEEYLLESLKEFYADKVIYMEIRSALPKTYNLDGTKNDKEWTLRAFQKVSEDFSKKHPDFLGIRIILSTDRFRDKIQSVVNNAVKLKQNYPDLIVGFDLVGREDTGKTLLDYNSVLSAHSAKDLPYYFHAGETNWQGTKVDDNLLDAQLLNTRRLGHGYALPHHPVVKSQLRKKGVAVEVCPISNQVLRLVSDLRNHPAAVLMAEGYPMVISSDDPTLFGNPGLSYDFYEAFVGIGGMSANLGTLKELAKNSITYSALPEERKEELMAKWQRMWDKFVSDHCNIPPEQMLC